MTGSIYGLIRIGTSGPDPDLRGMNPRWWDSTAYHFHDEREKIARWQVASNLPIRTCSYLPGGHVSGTMQFNGYPLLAEMPNNPAEEIAYQIQQVAAVDEQLIYLGSLPAYQWSKREDVAKCVRPYMVAGKTSLVIDQFNGWPDTPKNDRCLGELQMAFAKVIGEGGFTAADWMDTPIMHAADTHENIYAAKPEKYLQPHYVLIGNAPGSSREERRAWRLMQLYKWLKAGVHCIIDIDELAGVTYESLLTP